MALKAPNLAGLMAKPAATPAAASSPEAEPKQETVKTVAAPAGPPAQEKLPLAEPETQAEPEAEAEDKPDLSNFEKEDSLPAVAETRVVAAPQRQDEPEDGFEELDDALGYGSLPMVKLDKDELDVEGVRFKSLDVIMHRMKYKWMVKPRNEDGAPFCYSYDRKVDTKGRPISEWIAEWVEDGEMKSGDTPHEAKYAEIVSEVAEEGNEFDGRMVILNIAPASVAKLSGYRQDLKLGGIRRYGRALGLTQVVTRLGKGKLIKTASNQSFYPWAFSMVALAQPLEPAPKAIEQQSAE